MTPGAVRILDHWASLPNFRALTVAEAAARLQELLPHYPHPNDQPVAICVNGYRWFAHEMEAVADAIYRAAQQPELRLETLAGPDWNSDIGDHGLWALPGRCLARGQGTRMLYATPPGVVAHGSIRAAALQQVLDHSGGSLTLRA